MIPRRPRLVLPIWFAIAAVVGAFVFRSAVLRKGDFTLDIPGDIIVVVVCAIGIGLVAWLRRRHGDRESDVNDVEKAPTAE